MQLVHTPITLRCVKITSGRTVHTFILSPVPTKQTSQVATYLPSQEKTTDSISSEITCPKRIYTEKLAIDSTNTIQVYMPTILKHTYTYTLIHTYTYILPFANIPLALLFCQCVIRCNMVSLTCVILYAPLSRHLCFQENSPHVDLLEGRCRHRKLTKYVSTAATRNIHEFVSIREGC